VESGELQVNINTGKAWSAMDMADLENDVLWIPIELIAEFLCRNIDEVQAKTAELGLNPASESPPA
jgi:hypothetical protein